MRIMTTIPINPDQMDLVPNFNHAAIANNSRIKIKYFILTPPNFLLPYSEKVNEDILMLIPKEIGQSK